MRYPPLAFWLVVPATLGLLPPRALLAAEWAPALAAVRDVALGTDAALCGTVIDRQGQPCAYVDVLLMRADRSTMQARSAADGRFRFAPLPGGVYTLSAAGGSLVCRVWAQNAAPPGAASSALVVGGGDVARGQSPRTGFFKSDAFLITAAVLGAVAIPIFISAAGREQPPAS
jgi:hypothetical protein